MRLSFKDFIKSPIQHIAVAAGVIACSAPLLDMISSDAGVASSNLGLGLWLAAGYFWLTDAETWTNWMGA